jgi:hypothetical protein
MTSEAGIQLTHESTDPLHKEIPELLLEPLHHHDRDVLLRPESKALQCFLEGTERMEVTSCRSGCTGDESSSTFQCMDNSML